MGTAPSCHHQQQNKKRKQETQLNDNKQIVQFNSSNNNLPVFNEGNGGEVVLKRNLNYWTSKRHKNPKSSEHHVEFPALWDEVFF